MHREVFINLTKYTNDQIILVECISNSSRSTDQNSRGECLAPTTKDHAMKAFCNYHSSSYIAYKFNSKCIN